MNISILGTGSVGQTLSVKLIQLGHNVYMGTRDVNASFNNTQPDRWGNPSIGTWLKDNPLVNLCTFNESVEKGNDLIFFAMNGKSVFDCLNTINTELLDGKVMIDISNPLDFSNGFPPSLTVCNTDSIGEQVQNKYPKLKVVKSLNTMSSVLMVNPALVPGEHNVFLSGNDDSAKELVANVLMSFGWTKNSILDLGDITTSRGTEMFLPFWIRFFSKLQSPLFNFHINIAK